MVDSVEESIRCNGEGVQVNNEVQKLPKCKSSCFSEDVKDVFTKAYSFLPKAVSADDVIDVLQKCPTFSLVRVNLSKITIEEACQLAEDTLNKEVTVHKHRFQRSFSVCPHPILSDVLSITCTSDSFSKIIHRSQATVGLKCGNAVLRGADVYAPGIMGCNSGLLVGDKVSIYSDIQGKCRKGLMKKFDGEKVHVGNGIAMVSRADLFQSKIQSGIGIKVTESIYNNPSFECLQADIFYPQNLPSAVIGHAMGLKSGSVVLDMCAAPGGKTSHFASMVGSNGCVYAIDKGEKKVGKMDSTCKSLGLNNVRAFGYDSTKLCCDNSDDNTTHSLHNMVPPFPPETFNFILLDPPCSGLGQRPQFACMLAQCDLESYPIYQKKLFKQAMKLLKPNGTLIYSTCTLSVEENENQVAWALRAYPNLELTEQVPHIGGFGLTGHALDSELCKLVQRFDPVILAYNNKSDSDSRCEKKIGLESVDQDTIGFFIAKFHLRET